VKRNPGEVEAKRMEKEGPKHKQSKEELERVSETQRDREALRPPFSIDAFVLLPDHLHCIWTLQRGDAAFSRRWRLIKGAFSRKCTPEHTYRP
jgi:REP element-mobilizing transposase RayT